MTGGFKPSCQDNSRNDRGLCRCDYPGLPVFVTGSRKITHITEVLGMEEDVPILQDIFVYEITGEDNDGKLLGHHRSTGIARPRFYERARYYGEHERLTQALAAAEVKQES